MKYESYNPCTWSMDIYKVKIRYNQNQTTKSSAYAHALLKKCYPKRYKAKPFFVLHVPLFFLFFILIRYNS